jgi:serine/threonine-protein kinase
MTSVLNQGQALGEFEILEVAGIGGMGIVYRAKQRSLDRIVALKVIRDEIAEAPEYRERFVREAHIAASVDHPHIVSVYDVGDFDGRLVLVMQWVRGENLRTILQNSGALSPEHAVMVLSHLAGALDAVHSGAGLVHRDVKPSNVLIREVGGADHAYLTDFGVAKRSDTVADLTATGAVVGTVDYMAPEQITGGRADARTDIYALGCVFFEMLSGRVPYERDNSVAKLFAHVSDPPPRLEGVLAERYPTFGMVLEKAMAKNPVDRYLSAGDFARDANAALQGLRYAGAPTVVAVGEAEPTSVGESPLAGSPTAFDAATLEALRRTLATGQAQTGTVPQAPGPAQPPTGAGYAPTPMPPPGAPYAPTAVGQPTPLPPPGLQTPQTPVYQTYGQVAPPPAPPPRARKGSPLALILLAIVAAAGVAVGVVAALGLFKSGSGSNPKAPPRSAPTHAVAWKACGGDLSVGPDTSCAFARNVERAYDHGRGGTTNVVAFSPVTRLTYTMHCTGGSPHICRGGKGAAVRFYSGPPSSPKTSGVAGLRPCDQNISANAVTSCPFAEDTFKAYAHAYKRSRGVANEVVTAYSPVTGRTYTMSCTTSGGTVNCAGGNQAFVTFPLHAAQVY